MITTYTGKTIDLSDFSIMDPCLEDIAHSLALINRFNGHSKYPLSVAQHSVYVSRLSDSGWHLQGLLHDAAEAYIGDVTKWLKMTPAMAEYRKWEEQIDSAIMLHFGCKVGLHKSVKDADFLMVRYEARRAFGLTEDWLSSGAPNGMADKYPPLTQLERESIVGWEPMEWSEAEQMFLEEYKKVIQYGED